MTFILTGHRGAMDVAPENTLASFRAGVERGANEVELDLRMTKDGALVVLHDETLERTTNGHGALADLTYAQLSEFDAGGGERIPAFSDVIASIDVQIQVEIKEPAVVDPFLEFAATHSDALSRLSPCSNQIDVVGKLVAGLPESVVVGLTSNHARPDHLYQATCAGARRVVLGWEGADAELVKHAQQQGLHFGIQPVNTDDQFFDAIQFGVDGFTSNDPDVARRNGYELYEGALRKVVAN